MTKTPHKSVPTTRREVHGNVTPPYNMLVCTLNIHKLTTNPNQGEEDQGTSHQSERGPQIIHDKKFVSYITVNRLERDNENHDCRSHNG